MAGPGIIVTGAGSGIGRATARHFLAHGWRVALIGRREAALRETAQDHAQARILPCDVRDAAAVDAAFETVAAEWGRIDALFNNAGRGLSPALPDQVAPADFRDVIDINVTGMFLCARAAFRLMRAQDPQGGRIINNGSISAHAPRPGSVAYTVSKHAVTGLTRSLSLDGRDFGIACGQIDIGNAATELLVEVSRSSPAPEPLMDVAVVADAVLHMASLPEGANVQFMTVMATNMPFIGRG
ncbi:SDR family oxidoreductase [Paracoccus siganidrum]|uniref:SDR family oxidoreductase n=1 Tax=Paracoccus siganidrum TaxID=1276757 RepID=A0A419A593_9RHOB|nr:SDR family oxidoreductase [Paracoccus siganidrum]RJL10885.1 SDR family oxidoreductase [Paracoccus siganidrum]RMC28936.1 3-oxoacyl-ACP reductase [Paracoccus siganidrum]